MATVDFLKKIEILQGLTDEQLSELIVCWEEAAFQKGDKIFAEGEDASFMWVVTAGTVGLRFDLPGRPTSEENAVSLNTEGMTIGWSSFVPPHKYHLSAYCDSESCGLIKLERECLIKICEKDPAVGYVVMSNISKIIGKRFHQLQEEVIKRAGEEIMFHW